MNPLNLTLNITLISDRTLKKLLTLLVAGLLFVLGLSYMAPHDDTDPEGGRSGMGLYTDAATGCEYLTVPGHGMTPRLDASGKQRCHKQ